MSKTEQKSPVVGILYVNDEFVCWIDMTTMEEIREQVADALGYMPTREDTHVDVVALTVAD